MSDSTTILIATTELNGNGAVVAAGAELTAAAIEALGLAEDDIADLIQRGFAAETTARLAEPVVAGDAKALAAAEKRAAEAEAKAAALQAQVDDLTAQLAEATRPADKK